MPPPTDRPLRAGHPLAAERSASARDTLGAGRLPDGLRIIPAPPSAQIGAELLPSGEWSPGHAARRTPHPAGAAAPLGRTCVDWRTEDRFSPKAWDSQRSEESWLCAGRELRDVPLPCCPGAG